MDELAGQFSAATSILLPNRLALRGPTRPEGIDIQRGRAEDVVRGGEESRVSRLLLAWAAVSRDQAPVLGGRQPYDRYDLMPLIEGGKTQR